MIICDTHCDTLYNLQVHPGCKLDVTYDRLKEGGVSVQTMAMYVGPGRKGCDVEALMEGMLKHLEALKAAGYEGRVSIEAGCKDFAVDSRKAFAVLDAARKA